MAILEQIGDPLPGDHPSGIDTRIDRSFHRIRDARNEASRIEKRAAEDLGDPNKPQKEIVTRSQSVAFWKTVSDLGQQALAKQTKDLEIAAYVIEATLRTDGFSGLAQAFKVTRQMVENCWDTIFPMPDAEDGEEITQTAIFEERIWPISRLSGGDSTGLLIEPLSWIEITGGGDAGPYCYWQYRQALEFEGCSDSEKEIRRNRGAVTLEMFEKAVHQTSDAEYQELIDSIISCQQEYDQLIETLTNKIDAAGLDDPPRVSSSQLQDELRTCLATVRHITEGRFPDSPQADPINGEVNQVENRSNVGTSSQSIDKELRTRQDAFDVLNKVATFFERTEPQSLIPAQLRKVIRLGKLSPAEFFSEILDNSDVRDQLFKIYGLEKKSDD